MTRVTERDTLMLVPRKVLLLFVSAPLLFAWQQPAATQNALVKQYCVTCHNDKLKTAGISLEGLDIAKAGEDSAVWEKVLRKVSSSQMPPAGLPHPDAATAKAFTTYLQSNLDQYAVTHPDPGHPVIHRLNRAEYSNAIRDLFGLDIGAGANLPADDSGYGFDNIGDVLSLSPILIERYMTTGRMVARLAIGDTDVKPAVDTFTPSRDRGGRGRGPRNERISEDVPFDSAGGVSFQYTFPVDAEYVFKIQTGGGRPGQAAPAPELRIPVKAGVRHVSLTAIRSGAMPENIPGAARGAAQAGLGEPDSLDLRIDGARVKLFEGRGGGFANLSITGPYNILGPGDSASRRMIFVCHPASATEETPCARKILTSLVRRAYRRPATDADLKPLMALYDFGRQDKESGSFDNGIEMALRGMLVSPDFLFRIEHDPPDSRARLRAPRERFRTGLAALVLSVEQHSRRRASETGRAGQAEGSEVLRQQTARMLDDPKSKAFVNNFAGQYLFFAIWRRRSPIPTLSPNSTTTCATLSNRRRRCSSTPSCARTARSPNCSTRSSRS